MNLSNVPIEEHSDLVVRCPHCRQRFSCYEQPRRFAMPQGGRDMLPGGADRSHDIKIRIKRDGSRGSIDKQRIRDTLLGNRDMIDNGDLSPIARHKPHAARDGSRGARNRTPSTGSAPSAPRSISDQAVSVRRRADPSVRLPPIHSNKTLSGTLPPDDAASHRRRRDISSHMEAARSADSSRVAQSSSERRRERSMDEQLNYWYGEGQRAAMGADPRTLQRGANRTDLRTENVNRRSDRRNMERELNLRDELNLEGIPSMEEERKGIAMKKKRGAVAGRLGSPVANDLRANRCGLPESPQEVRGSAVATHRQRTSSLNAQDKSPPGHGTVLLSVCPALLQMGDGKSLADVTKKAVLKLSSPEWDECVAGLHEVVSVSHTDPASLRLHLKAVNRGQIRLLTNLRSTVARAACQATKHLFRTLRCTLRPEFDDIAIALLHRTADLNRFIRADANEALDAMVTYIPAFHSVRVLTLCAAHRNHLVRSAVARLLMCTVLIAGAESVVGVRANRETRKRVLRAVARFLADANGETRAFARELCAVLAVHGELEWAMQADVEPKVYEQVERMVAQIRDQVRGTETV